MKSRYYASQTQRQTLGIGWTAPVGRSQLDERNENRDPSNLQDRSWQQLAYWLLQTTSRGLLKTGELCEGYKAQEGVEVFLTEPVCSRVSAVTKE